MTNIGFKQTLTHIIFCLLCITGSLAVIAAPSNSSTSAQPQIDYQKPNPVAPMFAAREYSKDNDAVGIFVRIAPGSRYSPEQLGKALQQKFAKQGINSHYIGAQANMGASKVDFFVRGVPYSGYGLDKVNEGIKLATESIRASHAQSR